jgi:hypothetical protein
MRAFIDLGRHRPVCHLADLWHASNLLRIKHFPASVPVCHTTPASLAVGTLTSGWEPNTAR